MGGGRLRCGHAAIHDSLCQSHAFPPSLEKRLGSRLEIEAQRLVSDIFRFGSVDKPEVFIPVGSDPKSISGPEDQNFANKTVGLYLKNTIDLVQQQAPRGAVSDVRQEAVIFVVRFL